VVKVRVRYLFWLKTRMGVDEETYNLREPSLKNLIEEIISKHPDTAELLRNVLDEENPIIITINGRSTNKDQVLRNGDTVTFMPPASGG